VVRDGVGAVGRNEKKKKLDKNYVHLSWAESLRSAEFGIEA
jgi:hypothetical protein